MFRVLCFCKYCIVYFYEIFKFSTFSLQSNQAMKQTSQISLFPYLIYFFLWYAVITLKVLRQVFASCAAIIIFLLTTWSWGRKCFITKNNDFTYKNRGIPEPDFEPRTMNTAINSGWFTKNAKLDWKQYLFFGFLYLNNEFCFSPALFRSLFIFC